MEDERIMVDVIMTVYNHEKFIRQALTSILSQQVTFKVSIKIFDDCSTDNSSDIINQVITGNLSDRIAIDYIRQPKNLGMMKNGEMAFRSCSAKYVAICEGDDYWTDSLKLQKQIDFLEQHPDFGLVCSSFDCYHQNTGKTVSGIKKTGDCDLNFETLLRGNEIGTLTAVFRTLFISDILSLNAIGVENKWKMGDYPIWLMLSLKAKIRFLKDTTATYRVLENSATGRNNKERHKAFERSVVDVQLFFQDKYRKEDTDLLSGILLRALGNFYIANYREAFKETEIIYKQHFHKLPFKLRIKSVFIKNKAPRIVLLVIYKLLK